MIFNRLFFYTEIELWMTWRGGGESVSRAVPSVIVLSPSRLG
jgi:hypothetical protein